MTDDLMIIIITILLWLLCFTWVSLRNYFR